MRKRKIFELFLFLILLGIILAGVGLFAMNPGIIGDSVYVNEYRNYVNEKAQMKSDATSTTSTISTTSTTLAFQTENKTDSVLKEENKAFCKGKARCFSGKVTKVVDGDTIDVDGVRIRFTLVNTPEVNQTGYKEGKDFTAAMCPIGSPVLVDEDDGQTAGSYGRIIGMVYCSGRNVNEALAESGLAKIMTQYCKKSEFSGEDWAKKYGC